MFAAAERVKCINRCQDVFAKGGKWPSVEAYSVSERPKDDDHPRSTEDAAMEALEEGPLRLLGMFGRVGRLLGIAFARGQRFIAFSSDVGEAFRPVISEKWVRAGYGVAIAYIVADVALVTRRAMKKGEDSLKAFVSQSTFQVFGSLLIPSVAVHQTVHLANRAVTGMSGPLKKWGPVISGLAVIPFLPVLIDEPVEHAVNFLFDEYWDEVRSLWKRKGN